MTTRITVVGLGFGDEGKGSIVDYLARQESNTIVVRWNGGANAGHHVTLPDGRVHCFRQWGSGMLVPGTWTYLAPDFMLDPMRLLDEELTLRELGVARPRDRLIIDYNCDVVLPHHLHLSRYAEPVMKRGTTGMGVGWAKLIGTITVGDLVQDYMAQRDNPQDETFQKKLKEITNQISVKAWAYENSRAGQWKEPIDDEGLIKSLRVWTKQYIRRMTDFVSDLNHRFDRIIYEGAQGTLLDPFHGLMPPYVTRTRTLSQFASEGPSELWGVVRAYSTRHGRGPFPSEMEGHDYLKDEYPEEDNELRGSDFRIGWLDLPLLRHALEIEAHVDVLCVTNLDRLQEYNLITDYTDGEYSVAHIPPFEWLGWDQPPTPVIQNYKSEEAFLNAIEMELAKPVGLVSRGPTWEDKERRELSVL